MGAVPGAGGAPIKQPEDMNVRFVSVAELLTSEFM